MVRIVVGDRICENHHFATACRRTSRNCFFFLVSSVSACYFAGIDIDSTR